MQIETTVEHTIKPGFETPLTLEEVKRLVQARAACGSAREQITAFIEPQMEWYDSSTDRLPLGIADWLQENNLNNIELHSVAARVHSYVYKRQTSRGEVISVTDPVGRTYVHHITISAKNLHQKKSVSVKIIMGDDRVGRIGNNFAEITKNGEIIGAWIKVIQDGKYVWIQIKASDEPYRNVPPNVILATLAEMPKWPRIPADVFAYRQLRRRLAPRYEYNLYANPKPEKLPGEMALESKISMLNKQLTSLASKYRENHVSIPLSFWEVWQAMWVEVEKGHDGDEATPIDIPLQTTLTERCIMLVAEEKAREETRIELARRSR